MITGVLLSVTLLAISAQHADTLPGDLRDGRAALEAGDVARAIQLAERYSRSHDRDPRGYLLLGDAYAERMPSGRSTIEFEVSDWGSAASTLVVELAYQVIAVNKAGSGEPSTVMSVVL
jgi:hypothetical protein